MVNPAGIRCLQLVVNRLGTGDIMQLKYLLEFPDCSFRSESLEALEDLDSALPHIRLVPAVVHLVHFPYGTPRKKSSGGRRQWSVIQRKDNFK